MNIKCGLCENEIAVDGNLLDGQHVVCPYCGGKSEYRKPTRIDVPINGGQLRRSAKEDNAVSTKDSSSSRKPLRVIRNDAETSVVQNGTESQMVSRRLHMAEDHLRFYEEMKDIDHRRKQREKINGILMLIAVVLCAVGVYWYVGYRKEQRHRTELALAEERNRLEAERAENERREQARREVEEKARREKREAEEKANREKREAEEKRRKEENERVQNAILESKVLYRKVCSLFGDGEFDFLKALPTNSLPGKVTGEFYYLLPFLDNGEIVVCQSSTNGIESVFRLDGTGKKTSFEADTFLSSLEGKDYLVAYGNQVYFKSKRKKVHVAQIPKKEVVDLSKEFFGDIAPEVKRLDLDLDNLKFEIVFIPKESKKIIIADTIEYGTQYSLAKVREAIEDAYPMRTSLVSSQSKTKKFKRTVVLWDGAHIKKGVDGTTYVPRVAPPMAYNRTTTYGPGWWYDGNRNYWHNESKRRQRAEYTQAQWQALHDEAIKQDEAERLFYERQESANAKRTQSASTQAERDYAERIDRIYDAGALYFRAKIEKKRD